MPIKPITPQEVLEQGTLIPDEVFEIVNQLLVERVTPAKDITIYTAELAKLVANKLGITTDVVYNKNMLDFEKDYAEAGWKVIHESPARDENFKSYFSFTFKG